MMAVWHVLRYELRSGWRLVALLGALTAGLCAVALPMGFLIASNVFSIAWLLLYLAAPLLGLYQAYDGVPSDRALLLARPVSRGQWLAGKLLALAVLGFTLGLLNALVAGAETALVWGKPIGTVTGVALALLGSGSSSLWQAVTAGALVIGFGAIRGLLAFGVLLAAAVAVMDHATVATWSGSWWIRRCFDLPTLVDAPTATGEFRVPTPRVWLMVVGLLDHGIHAAAIGCLSAIGLYSRDLRDD
jgi:hypothetical protein